MSNKLQEVTDKICELLKGTELEVKWYTPNWSNEPILSHIREGELLTALKDFRTEHNAEYYMTAFGIENNDMGVVCCWAIGKPLTAQSPEAIESLHQILVR